MIEFRLFCWVGGSWACPIFTHLTTLSSRTAGDVKMGCPPPTPIPPHCLPHPLLPLFQASSAWGLAVAAVPAAAGCVKMGHPWPLLPLCTPTHSSSHPALPPAICRELSLQQVGCVELSYSDLLVSGHTELVAPSCPIP